MTTTQAVPATFSFESHAVRVIVIDGEPWFVAADLCKAIGLTNSRMSLQALDDDEKGVSSTDTLGGEQSVGIVSESGMFTLVLRCRDAVKPGTLPHRFRKWVTGEVLPAIRKTGRYEVQPAPAPESIDVESLLLDGMPMPSRPLPPELAAAIERRAIELAFEAHALIRLHLIRRATFKAEWWQTKEINVPVALEVVQLGGLGDALAYTFAVRINEMRMNLTFAVTTAQQLAAQMAA